MNPGSIGFLNLVVIAGIVAPFVASFIRQTQARYLYAAPLACLLIAWFTIEYEFNQVLAASGIAANITGIKLSPDYGTFVAGVASLVVAARVLKVREPRAFEAAFPAPRPVASSPWQAAFVRSAESR